MNKALLDTDILSEILKKINANVISKSNAYIAFHGHYTIATLSVLEIVKGLHKVRRESRIQSFLAKVVGEEIVTLDIQSAEIGGRIYADLERTGQPIGRADPIIAAIALRHRWTLVTGNTNHYQRIQSLGYPLTLDNWRV
jgi:tRNA(fMet)-specific endonuclease VapC